MNDDGYGYENEYHVNPKERDRVYRLLLEEIRTNQSSRKHWEEMINMPDEVKEREIFGFDCQISALGRFGEKIFGMKRKDLYKEAEKLP